MVMLPVAEIMAGREPWISTVVPVGTVKVLKLNSIAVPPPASVTSSDWPANGVTRL
jgi:hypothetical protein